MTYKELTKYLSGLTTDQLDSTIVVEVGDFFYHAEGLHIASGVGDYLQKDQPFLSIDSNPIDNKDFNEEAE